MSETQDTESTAQVDALPPGFQLRGYRLLSVLGRGGFGITYRAEDSRRGGLVAIKEFLPTAFAGREGVTVRAYSRGSGEKFGQFLKKFFDEATILLRFGHLNNIVNVRSYFEENGTGYIVMDFETGRGLDQYLKDLGRPTTETEARAILLPLLDDLGEMHAVGYLHRDIKPQNIIVRTNGTPVLIDFGAARVSAGEADRTMTAFISAGYTPWEQYSDDGRQGPWSDLYALGATAYQMVTGARPPDGLQRRLQSRDSYVSVVQAVEPGRYYSPEFLAAIDWVLQLAPEQRPQKAAEWRAAFGTGATESQPEPEPSSPEDDDETVIAPLRLNPGPQSSAVQPPAPRSHRAQSHRRDSTCKAGRPRTSPPSSHPR